MMNNIINKEILVSVVCIVYNHKKYIREALDSVLNQITDFNYEIIIHDDASTDGSTDIVREYASKYDNIIPVIQTENQYSKGEYITKFCMPFVNGKYVIFLECDDCWIDENKLQKQVKYLESHSKCPACAHQTQVHNMLTDEKRSFTPIKKNRHINTREVVKEKYLYHISSVLCRTNIYMDFLKCLKGINFNYFTADFAMEIFFTFYGNVYFMKENMTKYREYSSIESWTYQIRKSNKSREYWQSLSTELIKMFKIYDEYTYKKYHGLFERAISRRVYTLNNDQFEKKDFKDKYMRMYFVYEMPLKSKLYVIGRYYLPHIYGLYKKIVKE